MSLMPKFEQVDVYTMVRGEPDGSTTVVKTSDIDVGLKLRDDHGFTRLDGVEGKTPHVKVTYQGEVAHIPLTPGVATEWASVAKMLAALAATEKE